MDWEKKYKEALEKVKKLKNNWALTQNRAAKEIEVVFPELAETEVEKLKREIKETIDYANKNNNAVVTVSKDTLERVYNQLPDEVMVNIIISYLKADIKEYPEREERLNTMINYLEKYAGAPIVYNATTHTEEFAVTRKELHEYLKDCAMGKTMVRTTQWYYDMAQWLEKI